MNIWERNIQEWYDKSGTARLSYLDLATTEKPKLSDISHNIAVIYDRVCLSSKVNLKEFRSQQLLIQENTQKIESLERKIQKLEKSLSALTQTLLNPKPITLSEIQTLAHNIALQPKAIEEQAIKISQETSKQLLEVKELLKVLIG